MDAALESTLTLVLADLPEGLREDLVLEGPTTLTVIAAVGALAGGREGRAVEP